MEFIVTRIYIFFVIAARECDGVRQGALCDRLLRRHRGRLVAGEGGQSTEAARSLPGASWQSARAKGPVSTQPEDECVARARTGCNQAQPGRIRQQVEERTTGLYSQDTRRRRRGQVARDSI